MVIELENFVPQSKACLYVSLQLFFFVLHFVSATLCTIAVPRSLYRSPNLFLVR